MRYVLSSRIMPRTTIDIDPSVLRELKRRQRREGKTLGQLVSELLARELDHEAPRSAEAFEWTTRPMQAQVDLEDKESVRRALGER
jgi:hypothetical protein